jgi:hypothetical protein
MGQSMRNLQQLLYGRRYVLPAHNEPGPAIQGQVGLRYFGPIQAFAGIRFWVRAFCLFLLLSSLWAVSIGCLISC